MEKLNPYIGLAGRIMIVLIFPLTGYGKLSGFSGTQAYMESLGVPGLLLPLALLLEFGGALALILGWQTRIVALMFAGFCLLTALVFHNRFGDQIQFLMFMKNVSMAGGFLLLVKFGAGELSLDSRHRAKAQASRNPTQRVTGSDQ